MNLIFVFRIISDHPNHFSSNVSTPATAMQPAATAKISRYSPVTAIAIAQTTAPINEPNVFAKLNAANERPTERTSGNVARFNPWLTPSYTTYAKPANSAYNATAIALSIGVNGSTTATTNNRQAAIAGIRESLKARAK